MTTLEEVHARLETIFHTVFDDDTIEIFDAMTAADVEDWDSMEHINLIVACEKEFGIKFALSEIADIPDVGNFKLLILNKLNET